MSRSDTSTLQRGNDVRHYWDLLVPRLPLVALIAILGAVIAGVYLYFAPMTYTASTTLSVFPLSSDRFAANRNTSNLVDMTAEAVMASSYKVADTATEELPEWSATELRESTSVFAGADSTTMTIKVTANSEARARSGAGAVADAYLLTRSDQAASSIEVLVERDRARVEDYRDQLSEAVARLDAAETGSTSASRAEADLQILNQQIATLLSRISSLEGVDTTGGVVLNPAAVTPIVVEPSRLLVLATGGAMGLMLGVVTAYLLPISRRIVRTPRDIARVTGVNGIGILREGDATGPMIAALSERLLQLVSVAGVSVVSFSFDRAVKWPSALVDRIASEMRASGVAAVVRSHAELGPSGDADLVLVAVPPNSSQAARLRALRISGATVLVAGARATRVSSVRDAARLAEEMGAPIIATLLVAGTPLPWDPAPGEQVRNANEASKPGASRSLAADEVSSPRVIRDRS